MTLLQCHRLSQGRGRCLTVSFWRGGVATQGSPHQEGRTTGARLEGGKVLMKVGAGVPGVF